MTPTVESKFTKGPWLVEVGDDPCVRQESTAIIVAVRHRTTKAQWRADAHLIAAAPELYEALAALLEEHNCDDGAADYDGTTTECKSCIPAKSALAKASGGTR